MTGQTNIQIIGVKKTIKALGEFEPELKKRMNSEIRKALTQTRNVAKGKYPGGAWSININNKKLLGSIAATAGGGTWGTKSLSELAPGTRAAILEFIGTKYSGNRPQVVGLINTMNARYGSPGRFLWAAWEQTGDTVLKDIESAVLSAERDLQASLDAAGEGY